MDIVSDNFKILSSNDVEKYNIAKVTVEQIKRIKEIERELELTLVAYKK